MDPDIQAAMVTEYFSSYSFKADNIKVNSALIVAASLLQGETKTPKQVARSVLAKALNRITGSMTLGAIYVAHLLLGHGDSYISYQTQIVDFRAYVRAFYPSHAHRLFSSSPVAGETAHSVAINWEEGTAQLVTEVQTYKCRNGALGDLSPVELAMGFDLDRHPPTKTLPLDLHEDHPKASTHGHRRRPRPVLPQFISNLPPRPDDSSHDEDREAYAAYALALFYSDRRLGDLGEPGDTLWQQLQAWPIQKPRGPLDTFALRMLGNAERQAAAREAMSRNAHIMRMSRKADRKNKAPCAEEGESEEEGDSDDEGWKGRRGQRNDGLDDEFEIQIGGDLSADEQLREHMDDYLAKTEAGKGPIVTTVDYAMQNLPKIDKEAFSKQAYPLRVRERWMQWREWVGLPQLHYNAIHPGGLTLTLTSPPPVLKLTPPPLPLPSPMMYIDRQAH